MESRTSLAVTSQPQTPITTTKRVISKSIIIKSIPLRQRGSSNSKRLSS
jgi:hypothetical protein